jgi:hypothetical protein
MTAAEKEEKKELEANNLLALMRYGKLGEWYYVQKIMSLREISTKTKIRRSALKKLMYNYRHNGWKMKKNPLPIDESIEDSDDSCVSDDEEMCQSPKSGVTKPKIIPVEETPLPT